MVLFYYKYYVSNKMSYYSSPLYTFNFYRKDTNLARGLGYPKI